ncbi:glycosyltransferase family 4 protein [Aliarcobacter butzleri]|uniref:glycosyltransferase family 4 protein n=1 Tax=Aliarcobacter butzleri TaxID=28197 RepID=UPI0021B32608|nr:glycosyltransferase family 4 protein [Aliarcobacter butzleri]MCT7602195.1 glycosyltransferase family 4 protein [Aliarcobacter butzleri]MCT7606690.1 glycosyltransferase family 4 protein [Aliarcobacter butzleri]MCT7608966.1 glycosyltransferase family 4 protein [Aliarcobacter butzleri]MCT7640125.1 glycosyltransferase family 4 protein [Aliarcobacter butzleri]UWY59746.1 glycosyltransferase family 4 protein [Aliarcobacter butzleri]
MKKILEVCLSPDLGGLELYMKNITKYLDVTAVINKKGKLKNTFEKEGIKHFVLSRYNFYKLSKIIDKEKIDIVHLHWTKDIPVVVFAKLFSKRKPKIIQTRHMHMTRFKSDFYHKFLYKNIDMIIAVTNLVKEQLDRFIPEDIRPKIETSYIGANTPNLLSDEEKNNLKRSFNITNEFVVCIVGRVEEAKGQHIVLKAVDKLRKNGIDARTLVIGHYMDKNYFNNLKNIYPNDIFTDFVNNPTDFMQISDCVVLATKKETFGLVLIEAMKCQICVLGSSSGGPLEIIDDEKTGLLFESMNDDNLYEKLLLIIKDDKFKKSLALNGKNKADEFFDSKKQFNELECILRNI